MKAMLRLDKEAIFEAVKAYVLAEMPKAEVAKIEHTGFYGNIEITVTLTDRTLSPAEEVLDDTSSIYLKELD